MARILIVDDSPSQLMGMKRIVEKLGHEALSAEDGAAGVEAAKANLPDLILMDVVMPNLNGFQATRAISKEATTAHIPVVLVTTKDQETDKVWACAKVPRPTSPSRSPSCSWSRSSTACSPTVDFPRNSTKKAASAAFFIAWRTGPGTQDRKASAIFW